MSVNKEDLKLFDEQYRELIGRCGTVGDFSNKSAIEFLHMGIMYFIKQYRYHESLEDLLNAYFGIAGDIIDDVIYDYPNNTVDKATHVQVTSSITTPEQKEIGHINRELDISEKEIEHMKDTSTVHVKQHQETVRGYEKDILFSHDYTPKFEVQDTLFEKIITDPDMEGPIYPPLKALSKQREEEAHKLFYPMLKERFALDRIDMNTIGLFNEFVSILTFFEDNRDRFIRTINRGYITARSGRQHGLYIDAINVTNPPTPDNIRAKYRYTVNEGKVYYQFRIERQDCVEEFTLGKDDNKEIAEIVEYRFEGCQRLITINLDRFTNAENIGPLSQFFVELAQSFDRRFDQR